MTAPAHLRLVQPVEVPREPYRTAEWVRAHVFDALVSRRWVLDHCPRVPLSRGKILFRESEVRAWADTLARRSR